MSDQPTKPTTARPETEVVADPDLPLVRITREFDAPPDAVFRAHADPDLFARWIGPRELSTTIDRFDCRTGGSYRYVQTAGDERYAFYGSFHEVRPGERIVQTFTYEDMPDGVTLERQVFEDLGGGRTRLVVTSMMDSFEGRDALIASGMEQGVREGYEKLDDLLAQG